MADVSRQIMASDEELSRVRTEGLGELVPPAVEPLKAKVVNALADVIVASAGSLAPNGELGEIKMEKVSGTVDALPPDIASKVMVFAQFAQDASAKIPELEPYAFEPGPMMTTNSGLDEIQSIISAMGSDPAVQKAMRAPPPAGGAPPEEGMMDESAMGEEG